MDIYMKTKMTALPDSCRDCELYYCQLPGRASVGKPYFTRRHKECPLRTAAEIVAGHQEGVEA